MTYKRDIQTAYRYKATADQAAQINELLQAGRCELCKKTGLSRRDLAIEHNHKTGKLRGVTCFSCNTKIGIAEKRKNWDTCNLDILDWITYRGH